MALEFDTTMPPRNPSELRTLIRAISAAEIAESEPAWVEWKSFADLSSSSWHGTIAKYLIGFANREPDIARRHVGGSGYLIVGVEPGDIKGVTRIDNAKLEDGLSRHVDRTRVRWHPTWIDFDDVVVLVIEVAPPSDGDSIATLLRQFTDESGKKKKTWSPGTIFVRRNGQTAPATPSEVDMLARRAMGRSLVSEPGPELRLNANGQIGFAIVTNPGVLERFTIRMEGFRSPSSSEVLVPRWSQGAAERILQKTESDWARILSIEPDSVSGSSGYIARSQKPEFDRWFERQKNDQRLVRLFGDGSAVDLVLDLNREYVLQLAVLSDTRERVETRVTYGVAEDSSLVMPFDDERVATLNLAYEKWLTDLSSEAASQASSAEQRGVSD